MARQLVKVRFTLDPEDWHGYPGELLWAAPSERPGTFQLRNSPFYAKDVAYLDVVEATPDIGPRTFNFQQVIERGGHSTYMVLLLPDEPRAKFYWQQLQDLGCSYESGWVDLSIGQRLLYSVDVPPEADLFKVREILEKGEREEAWLFQQGYAHVTPSSAGRS